MNTTNRPNRSAVAARDRGRRLALTHTVLIVTRPAGVEFHLDHRVDATRGQHRVVGAEGLVAWLADAGSSPIAVRVVASCPCRGGGTSVGTPCTVPDRMVRGRRAIPPDSAITRAG